MKLKQKKTTKTTLSEKIADALTVKPRADIEDDHVFGTKPKTLSRAELSSSDSEDDALISDFRKRNVNLLSEISKKYEGKVVSRKDLEEDSEIEGSDDVGDSAESDNNGEKQEPTDDSELGDESDDYSITKIQKQITGTDESDVTEGGDDEDDEGDHSGDDENEGYDISALEEPVKENFEHMKKENISEEAKKGVCVRNELLIWEGLLEMRIHLQRCMNSANKMPFNDTYVELKENTEFMEESNKTINNVALVLDKLLTIQNILFKNFPETKSLSNKKTGVEIKKKDEESDEEIPSDTDNEEIPSDTDEEPEKIPEKEQKVDITKPSKKRKLEDYEKELDLSHKAFKSFRDNTIQKWNEKTRITANIKNAPTNTILQQINYILSDRNKLIRRTQLKRSEYDIIGYKQNEKNKETNENHVIADRKENDEYIPEIFDDSDFYHQLLRELIECKSADISDPVQLSRQWIALQQMRSKMKRKVDTKATKGRRIKYVVHNQLVNYMAPEKSASWTDESKNELYSSLFGKMFEHNNIGLNVNLENGKIKE
ncbi:PREDICTED: protein Aatf [Papilio polytes]|uniref:protein Aatf n=1 Tax=Papilio polytes TaxID=76194 RepID=UPI000675E7CA|nr:PREDICTED: protein Aatf [Papilio polytes]